jgi:hypothetical protein
VDANSAGTRSDPLLGAIDEDAHRDRANYRFKRRQGDYSSAALAAAASVVEKVDPAIGDPMTYAGVCIEWAKREHRQWLWRCTRDHQLL